MSIKINFTSDPVAVPALAEGVRYVIQNQGTRQVYAEGGVVAPDKAVTSKVVLYPSYNTPPYVFELDPGESLFVWGDPGDGDVIYNEAL